MSELILDVTKLIRQATELLEKELSESTKHTRRHAELYLAWDNMINAHSLLTTGRMTPEGLVWAWDKADQIAASDSGGER